MDAQRYFVPDSYDFVIRTVGVYDNKDIVRKATEILSAKFAVLILALDSDTLEIRASDTTMENSFDIVLENEDYTIGKVIEYMLYKTYFEETKEMTFCGFKMFHPHDKHSIVRVAYTKSVSKSNVKQNLKACIAAVIQVYQRIHKSVVNLVKLK